MKVAIAADHAGFHLKEHLREHLRGEGHEVVDFGTDSTDSTDYPDYASKVAEQVAKGSADRGILVCDTGVGMAIAANKVHGIRAGLAVNEDTVRLTRAHNDANVLAIGSKFTSEEQADRYLQTFLNTDFDGGRHARRVSKIAKIEEGEGQ